ncbi:MAG: GNAT family N-acetyltransferase [Candidatus Dormibacteraeota bacterium]|uniref:GNAT family N-acetyltransferase n=1 Tax=Candidatus Aeolococcus gillhamiae TaxID=3127015 RepID=A0A2W5ZC51_9BACT|nr:GNAT family N-acetyltransferase [Candidatus Dormibacteraeota bacterium]PZR80416.1 MAG: hypothetical protein DLM65_08260 [Candidatus Dormibacter sp. RRmetagenome_bin12]
MDVVAAAELGDREWDRLCQDASGAWFWHTTAWRDYTLAYRPALASRSLAFAVVEGTQPLALVPLMVEKAAEHYDGQRFSFGGDACWSPAVAATLDPSQGDAALRAALHHVDELAEQHGVDSVALKLSPLAAGWRDHLPVFIAATTRAGYTDVSLSSQVIDLDVDAQTLRTSMTKGHRADVTRGRRVLDTSVTTGEQAIADFPAYRAMHALAAGRVTRPDETFRLMESWLTTGAAALVKAVRGDAAVGFTYLILHAGAAYYASAANHPDHAAEPIGHVLHAAAIDWLKARGFRRYELGLQQFGPLPHDVPSDKQLGIARFKRGFGGGTVPLMVREKWFSKEAYRRAMGSRIERYAT